MTKTKQVNLFNLKTSDFYTNEERENRNNFNVLEFYDKNIKDWNEKIKYHQSNSNTESVEFYQTKINELDNSKQTIIDAGKTESKHFKSELRKLVKENKSTRTYNNDIEKAKKIATFTSSFTRALGINEDRLETENTAFTDLFIVVSVTKDVDKHIQNDIMSQLITYGINFNDKTYTYAFSGAGQIRTKKLVFVDEMAYQKAQDKLYAGLTDDVINKKGGFVVGKLLAYKALSASASVKWDGFDINKCIVVKDFEHIIPNVEVETIDWDYQISDTTKMKDLINPVMDGCGIMLPTVYNKNIQFRAPWMKGLLSPFPYDNFIELHNINLDTFTVEDAWGTTQSLKGIEIIFTESQFKARKYFDSWDDYVKAFEKNKCEAAICNEESLDEDDFKDSTISYQMLQTLYNMTTDEIEDITSFTRQKIEDINVATNKWYQKDDEGNIVIDLEAKKTLLNLLGVDTDYTYKRPFTNALKLANEKLLFDKYVQQLILKSRDAMVEAARAGKLIMEGSRTTYILPDLYAFCEWLFLEKTSPEGLLEANEVSCALFNDGVEVDMLRSPHLYIEHCIHTNRNNDKLSEWYITKGTYVSINSTASFVLAYDNDGDICQLVPAIEEYKSSNTFVNVAKRHMQGVYVLDYEMATSDKVIVDKKAIVKALKNSFKANIGTISNQITKIFNKDSITDNDLKLVKLLKMKNNFTIDFAKTNFDPKIEDEKLNKEFDEVKKLELPYFFKFAKNKKHKEKDKLKENEKNEVADKNNSVMNQISTSFKDFTSAKFARNGKFDYTLLTSGSVDLDNEANKEIISVYEKFVNAKSNTMSVTQEIEDIGDVALKFYVKSSKVDELKAKLMDVVNDEKLIVNVLISYLYSDHKYEEGQKQYKNKNLNMLWDAFGDVMLNNIDKKMLPKNKVRCGWCKIIVDKKSNRQTKCESCADKAKRVAASKRQAKCRAKDVS